MQAINKYNNSKIYMIGCHLTGLKYIGSTTQTLKQRLGQHESLYKAWKLDNSRRYFSSFKVFASGDYSIETVEFIDVDLKIELRRIEGTWIKKLPNCVNKLVAGRTPKEYKADNIKQSREYQKLYRERNIEQIKAYQTQYRLLDEKKAKKAVESCKNFIFIYKS